MDMEEAHQGDLADVVARASAVMAAAPSSTTPPYSPAAAMAAGHQQIMLEAAPPAMMDGYCDWLPPPHHHQMVQISQQHAMAATDVDADEAAVRISSPPAHHQIIKRKNEVKKVVCIPALPPTSSRPGGGEVIPSDLWAWRKYGQKPIKGSPYPRGYYRCSSSKGCMARKQVERSRSDPNMLVITYTAEHNHPWPMQRNVLAGYSRPHTQTTANNNCKKKNSGSSRVDPLITSSSSPSKKNNDVVGSGNLEQMTDMMEAGNNAVAAGYVAAYTTIGAALDEEGVAAIMHQPMRCNSIQTADEVFAELEELEPASIDPVSANSIYSRGVSYEWHKF